MVLDQKLSKVQFKTGFGLFCKDYDDFFVVKFVYETVSFLRTANSTKENCSMLLTWVIRSKLSLNYYIAIGNENGSKKKPA